MAATTPAWVNAFVTSLQSELSFTWTNQANFEETIQALSSDPSSFMDHALPALQSDTSGLTTSTSQVMTALRDAQAAASEVDPNPFSDGVTESSLKIEANFLERG